MEVGLTEATVAAVQAAAAAQARADVQAQYSAWGGSSSLQ
jgi:hypothetical protein